MITWLFRVECCAGHGFTTVFCVGVKLHSLNISSVSSRASNSVGPCVSRALDRRCRSRKDATGGPSTTPWMPAHLANHGRGAAVGWKFVSPRCERASAPGESRETSGLCSKHLTCGFRLSSCSASIVVQSRDLAHFNESRAK